MNDFSPRKTLLLFLFSLSLFGQTKKSDLMKLSYEQLTDLYFDHDKEPSKQIDYANAYLDKACSEKNNLEKARGYYMFALLHRDEKARYLDSVIKYSRDANDKYFPTAAYCEKAVFLKKKFKFREVIDNYLMAEKSALKNNIDYYYRVRFSIAVTKSEDLGEVNEALQIYKECYRYYKTKNIRDPKYSLSYQNVLFGLADTYKALFQTDSSTYYNKLGYTESKITKNEQFLNMFILNEGANLVLKKNFISAIDSIQKALPKIIEYNDGINSLASYYYLGKAYEGLNNKDKAARNFIKVDSIYKITKNINPEFISGYQFLISYYKDKGDKENQLKYLTIFMNIDNTLQNKYKQLNKMLLKEYDFPHLVKEKESLILSLKNDKNKSFWVITILFAFVISVTVFGFYQQKLKKKYRARFEKIVNQTSVFQNSSVTGDAPEIISESKTTKDSDIGISEELINQILDKLYSFEKKKKYLQSNITVQALSNEFETNSKYVSKVVNAYKGKTFIQYVNDLRIEYAIINLQKNKKLRKYTIQALSLEFGFNNAESFSAAFYKKTGIKPTFFIKELDKADVT